MKQVLFLCLILLLIVFNESFLIKNIKFKSTNYIVKPNNNILKNFALLKDREREYSNFGVFKEIAEYLDDTSDGFALDYPDLSKYPPLSIYGFLFLLTNIMYEIAGIKLQLSNANFAGLCVEIAGIISIYYHWAQLYYGPEKFEVQRVLLIDYCTASAAIFSTTTLLANVLLKVADGIITPNNDLFLCVGSAMTSILCLLISWVENENNENYGRHYLTWHGLWHVFGAISALYLSQLVIAGGIT